MVAISLRLSKEVFMKFLFYLEDGDIMKIWKMETMIFATIRSKRPPVGGTGAPPPHILTIMKRLEEDLETFKSLFSHGCDCKSVSVCLNSFIY